MKTASKIKVLLLHFFRVVPIAACQMGTTPHPESTPTIDQNALQTAVVATVYTQMTETAAPTPSSTPFPPEIIFLQGETPSFITGKSSLPVVPGTYLLHENPSTYGLAYASLDGLNRGTLLNYKNISRGSSFSPQLFMMSSAESPKLIFTHLEDNEIDIWTTNLVGNLLKSWHTQVTFDAGSECYAPWIPSDGHWLVLECGPENKNLTYFVDLNSTNKEIISPGLDCGVGYNDIKSSFPYGEAEWLLWCDKPQEYCFLSRFENKKLCLDLSNAMKSSPANLSKEVVVEGDMLHGSDGTVPGTRIVVFDRACLLKQTPCGPSQEFELPYYQPMDISKMIGPSLEIKWDQDGNKIAWSLAPFGALGPLHTRAMGPVTSGIIDLVGNINQILWQELPASTKLASWSPDGEWLLFSDQDGLYVGSIKHKNIRRLVTEQYGTTFYGWLTIP